MIILLTFAFLLVVVAFYMFGGVSDLQTRNDAYDIIARQMIYYHVAANRVCGATCESNPIDPTPELATFRRSQGGMAPGAQFRSLAQGDYVITYYVNSEQLEMRRQFNAGVSDAIQRMREVDTQTWFATYDAAGGRLTPRSNVFWTDPTTGVALQTSIADPAVIAPIPAFDGAPVLVNKRR